MSTKRKKYSIQDAAKAGVFCGISGMLAGLVQYLVSAEYAIITLVPGLFFGIALAIANKDWYKNFIMTLVGLVIVSTAIYPIIVVMSQRISIYIANVDSLAKIITRFPFLGGLIPSIVGASLLYLVYATFLEKFQFKMFQNYLIVAAIIGVLFFPLMQWTDSFILSYMVWQGVIGFFLSRFHQ